MQFVRCGQSSPADHGRVRNTTGGVSENNKSLYLFVLLIISQVIRTFLLTGMRRRPKLGFDYNKTAAARNTTGIAAAFVLYKPRRRRLDPVNTVLVANIEIFTLTVYWSVRVRACILICYYMEIKCLVASFIVYNLICSARANVILVKLCASSSPHAADIMHFNAQFCEQLFPSEY